MIISLNSKQLFQSDLNALRQQQNQSWRAVRVVRILTIPFIGYVTKVCTLSSRLFQLLVIREKQGKKQWLAGNHNHFFLFTLFSINPTNLKPLTPMSDQDRISPYNINTMSSRQVMRIKKKISIMDYMLIQYQILHTNITRTV